MMDYVDFIKYLAKMDFEVFPLHPGGKMPRTPHGFKDASTNPEQIDLWWQRWPEANYGIATGGAKRLLVIDIDVKNGAPGMATLAVLEEKQGLIDALRVQTPSGGLHLFTTVPEGIALFSSSANRDLGVDIRCEGGYVVGPGSVIDDKTYEIIEGDFGAIPEAAPWLIEWVSQNYGAGRIRQKQGGQAASVPRKNEEDVPIKRAREEDTSGNKTSIPWLEPSASWSHRPTSLKIGIPTGPSRFRPSRCEQWKSGLRNYKVRHEEGFLFFSLKKMNGRAKAKSAQARVGAFTVAVISRFWDEALTKACADGIKVPEAFTARRLRSTYVTALRGAGADFAVLQRYIGHAPSTILSAHYDKVDMARLKSIADLGQDLYDGSGVFDEKKTPPLKNGRVGPLMGNYPATSIESIAVSS